MAIPAEVVTAMNDGLADALTVAALALMVVIGLAALRYMRQAIGDNPYSGYTVSDDVADRASAYQAERSSYDGQGNYTQSDSKQDFSDASKDVIRQQKYF